MLYKGLKSEVKNETQHTPKKQRPTIFQEYADYIIEIDDRLYEFDRQLKYDNAPSKIKDNSSSSRAPKQSSSSSTTTPSHSSVPSSTASLPPGVPIDIDAIRTGKKQGPIDANERKFFRRDNGLCMYSRADNHLVAACPNISDASRKAYAERQAKAKAKAVPQSGKA
ncbi:hypothetical protein HGRIS_006503 [Hohenbuehelia grisea]|uniref:Uncharacterized protein n=1 Tax=Hohenbuehelia grisea TaxID=104357 RepID=A0ABR3J9Q5_9AGAR